MQLVTRRGKAVLRRRFAVAAFVALAASACAQGVQDNMPADNVDTGGSGDSGGTSGSGTGGSGVTSAGHGGTVATGGTGATTASGGSAGKGGATSTGGSVGSGGTTAANGGSVGNGGTSSGGTASGGKGGTSAMGGTTASGGKGGTTGTGGTVASGGSGGSVSGNGVKVQYKVVTADAMTPYMQCELYVMNAGPSTFAVSELKARYYYTDDVKTTMQFTLNWKHIGTTGANVDDLNVTQAAMAMVPTATNADTYLEFGFSSGSHSTIGPGESLNFSWRFNPTDQNLKFNQTNDYSFDAGKTAQADWSHVVVLHNAAVIWGATP